MLSPTPCGSGFRLGPAVLDKEGQTQSSDARSRGIQKLLETTFQTIIMDDNRSGEIVLLHRATKTLILSDLLYKSNPKVTGPGGGSNHYTKPEWFA